METTRRTMIPLAGGLLMAIVLCGCQSVSKVEFYEPTPDNEAYSIKATETMQGHGPVKLIEGKSGVPDFSDNKSYSFKMSILGL